jgi:hypothetical protein
MSWNTPYIIYRITADGKLEEVFRCEDIKKAKYWLTYIAEPGDVLCKTPAHPKHSKVTMCPEYWSHKVKNVGPVSNERDWKNRLAEQGTIVTFPEDDQGQPA